MKALAIFSGPISITVKFRKNKKLESWIFFESYTGTRGRMRAAVDRRSWLMFSFAEGIKYF